MKQSHLFTKTRKEAPSDEEAKNAQLLIRAGFIHKELAGVYSLLPLGKRVYDNICTVIREEMNTIGGVELHLSALQESATYEQSGRWSDEVVDVWFKTHLKNDTELGLGFTHEEPLTRAMTNHISSYRDLPAYPYQIQTKFRNETRAKSGIMRGREFVMKDLYSFSKDQSEHDHFYEQSKTAYMNVYKRLGLGDKTYVTFASGGSFAKYSHEFQTIADIGEDTIYVHAEKGIAINEEVYTDEVLRDLGVTKEELTKQKAVEVGNIFSLGTKFSEAIGLYFTDKEGNKQPVIMGSYGIGPTRVMGLIAELLSDEHGLVWSDQIAPFKVHLISINQDQKATELYDQLTSQGISALFDDRDVRPGQKFADSDLIGIPHRVVISDKSLDAGGLEYKARTNIDSEIISREQIISKLTNR